MLQGKTAIITGCTRGIGRAVLEAFAANGANIWACTRRQDNQWEEHLGKLRQEHGVSIRTLCFDVADEEQVRQAMRTLIQSHESVDILVNNAAQAPQNKAFLMTPLKDIQLNFQINFFSALLITQSVARIMIRQKRGSILNITSIAATDVPYGQMEYVTSKAALAAATKKLAHELAPYGIRANAIAPGLTDTDMLREMAPEVLRQGLVSGLSGRLGKPEEIAQVAVFLASDLSGYINGQVIRVDGGMV